MELTRIAKIEASLRLGALLLFALTACVVGLDSETKNVVYVKYRVTYKHLKALGVLVYVCSVVAAYHLLQLGRCYFSARNPEKSYNHVAAWSCYLLDQFVLYITFGATSAAAEHSVLVLSGADGFQWMKWCNRFTRFCFQIGGSLVCAYVACFLMIIITSISAFNLFRLYSPQKFLALKTT